MISECYRPKLIFTGFPLRVERELIRANITAIDGKRLAFIKSTGQYFLLDPTLANAFRGRRSESYVAGTSCLIFETVEELETFIEQAEVALQAQKAAAPVAPPPAVEQAPHIPEKIEKPGWAVGMSDTGKYRVNNQDYFLLWQDPTNPRIKIAIGADGAGYERAGDYASRRACEIIQQHIIANIERIRHFDDIAGLLKEAVTLANAAIWEEAERDLSKKGMATTIDVMVIVNNLAYIAHAGDGRVYLLPKKEAFEQLTRDNDAITLAAQIAASANEIEIPQKIVGKDGVSKYEEEIKLALECVGQTRVANSPLQKAVGFGPEIDPDIITEYVSAGSRLLFATDGLHAKTPSFLDIMEEKADGPMDEMAMSMMKAAYPVSKDNATVVIVEV